MNELKWFDATQEPFAVYGFDDGIGGITARIPDAIARTINRGVHDLSVYSAGGRIRFKTNSPRIGLRVSYGRCVINSVNDTARLRWGFTLYKVKCGKEMPVHVFCPPMDKAPSEYDGVKICDRCDEPGEYTLVFPCFAQILSCQIGISQDAVLKSGRKYINQKPVIFYGSSITHGSAATTSGNTYEQMISRKYNLNYVNLGFAGNARGETEIAEYIAERDMCAFVCDYDHNAPDFEHLTKTYPILYKTVRVKHPHIPYIMVSKPDFLADIQEIQTDNKNRRDFIKNFYEKTMTNGDENVYFVDGETFFPPEYNLCCTVDMCHPNDLGFSYMAERIGNVIAKVLKLD